MKIKYKELKCNKNSSIYTIAIGCIRRYLPEVELINIKNITCIYKDTYRVIADFKLLNSSVQQAIFQMIIPTDMRKNILFMSFYSKSARLTKVDKAVNGDNIILSIKDCYHIDTLNFKDNNIVIREETIRFRVKPYEEALEDYFSLYIDNECIVRLHNRNDIRNDITYIYANVDSSYRPSLFPGYIKKSVYCKGTVDYKGSDHITINRLTHNFSSTRYCLRYRDVLYMPEKYMNYVRGILGIKKWG